MQFTQETRFVEEVTGSRWELVVKGRLGVDDLKYGVIFGDGVRDNFRTILHDADEATVRSFATATESELADKLLWPAIAEINRIEDAAISSNSAEDLIDAGLETVTA